MGESKETAYFPIYFCFSIYFYKNLSLYWNKNNGYKLFSPHYTLGTILDTWHYIISSERGNAQGTWVSRYKK